MSPKPHTPTISEANTSGTIINLIQFRNNVPSGLIQAVAMAGLPCNMSPTITPKMSAMKMRADKPKFFMSFSPFLLFYTGIIIKRRYANNNSVY